MDDLPHAHGWREAMSKAWASPRCGACTRQGVACRSPAMRNGRCRMHGGSSTGAKTLEGLARVRTATLTHGRRTAERVALRRQLRAAFVQLRDMVKAADAEMREEQRLHRDLLRRFER